MIPGAFDYQRPASVADAVKLLAANPGESLVIAGGHSLVPMMKLRMAQPEQLVDLRAMPELRGITVTGREVDIGAMVTQSELIGHEDLAEVCPLLRETSLQIADPQIRNLGTLGGNAANGDPGNDMPAVLQALDARYMLEGPGGEREVAARDYYQSAYETARADDEILIRIRLTAPAAGHGCAYEKQKRKVGDYATAAAAVILVMDGGKCTDASIALTNVADTPLYAANAVAALVGSTLDGAAIDAAAVAAMAITDPAADGRGPAEFRRRLTGVMVRRAIARAAA